MKTHDLKLFARALPKGTRLIGLDLGTKTIGVALSDLGLMVATPADLVKRTKFNADFTQISTLINKESVGGIVIGFPLEMDGSQGKSCHRVLAFVDELEKRAPELPILMWDERLTTAEAERGLIEEADLSRARRAELVDKTAAAIILQNVLDALDRLES